MNHPAGDAPPGTDLDAVAVALVRQSSMLTRLVFMHVDVGVPRSEAGVLARLEEGSMRISALAAAESLAQPTMTLVVKRLEKLALVTREPDPADGRATLISLTRAGAVKLGELRAAYRTFLSERLAQLPEHDLNALVLSMSAMADLIAVVQEDGV